MYDKETNVRLVIKKIIIVFYYNFFQALYVLCNLAFHGEEICSHLVSCGVLQKVAPVLKSTDIEILNLGLSLVEMALRMTQNVS